MIDAIVLFSFFPQVSCFYGLKFLQSDDGRRSRYIG
jgi:hypothetical protein